ncbi:MAG: hypothetical protein JXD23_02225 [Spirochaetales bacterium]|nr:hypothetical protein [Spirochaetales bacterium]
METVIYEWDGECGCADDRFFRVRIVDKAGSWNCGEYALAVNVTEL